MTVTVPSAALQKYSESASGSFGRPSVFRDDERARSLEPLDPEGESRKLYDSFYRIGGYSCDVG
jgi:hypothetical protein